MIVILFSLFNLLLLFFIVKILFYMKRSFYHNSLYINTYFKKKKIKYVAVKQLKRKSDLGIYGFFDSMSDEKYWHLCYYDINDIKLVNESYISSYDANNIKCIIKTIENTIDIKINDYDIKAVNNSIIIKLKG